MTIFDLKLLIMAWSVPLLISHYFKDLVAYKEFWSTITKSWRFQEQSDLIEVKSISMNN